MKRILYLFIILSNFFIYSQNTHSVAVTGGITQGGYAADVSFNYRLDYDTWVQARAYGAMSTMEINNLELPYTNYAFTFSYFKNIYRNRRHTFNIAAGLGGLAGYEILNDKERRLSVIEAVDGESKVIYGVSGDLEIDFYLTESFSLILKTTQFAHINSDFGLLANYSSAGIRFYFF